MIRIACLLSILVASLRVYGGASSVSCSSTVNSTAECEPRASRSLLQQRSVGLETSRIAPPGAETTPDKTNTATSSKLLHRVFDNSRGSRLGVDVSLLETAFAKHTGALQHKEAAALLKSVGQEHIDPMGMQRHVEQEILPMAQRTTIELQEEIDNAMEAVTNCSSLMWDAEKALSHREKILNTDQEKEYGCLIGESEANHAKKEACDRMDNMLKLLGESEPAKIKNLKNKSVLKVIPAMKANMDFYSKAYSEFAVASAKCRNTTEAANAKHAECEVDKEVVEKFYCYMKEGRDKSCEDYAKCFEDSLENYRIVKGHVEKTEAINKEHFTQMACSSWVADSRPNCDLETTAHLDVSYPEDPIQSTCVQVMKFHGRGDHTKFFCEEASAQTPEAIDPVNDSRVSPLPPVNPTQQRQTKNSKKGLICMAKNNCSEKHAEPFKDHVSWLYNYRQRVDIPGSEAPGMLKWLNDNDIEFVPMIKSRYVYLLDGTKCYFGNKGGPDTPDKYGIRGTAKPFCQLSDIMDMFAKLMSEMKVKPRFLMGFNEAYDEHEISKGMTADETTEYWRKIVQPIAENFSLELVSPTSAPQKSNDVGEDGLADDKMGWLVNFLEACHNKRNATPPCNVSLITKISIHKYTCRQTFWNEFFKSTAQSSHGFFTEELRRRLKTRMPDHKDFWKDYANSLKYWVTEFNCNWDGVKDNAPSSSVQCNIIGGRGDEVWKTTEYKPLGEGEKFGQGSVQLFDKLDKVERYSWWNLYNSKEDRQMTKVAKLTEKSGRLTPLGRAYLDTNLEEEDCKRG